MRHLQKSGIITLKALGSPIGSRTTQVQEAYEVHYSDGIRAAKKFSNEKQAIQFAKDLIKSKKGLQYVDVFNAGSGFHSTADTDAIVAWWGKGSYTDNKSKHDSKLASKKINESIITEDMDTIYLSLILVAQAAALGGNIAMLRSLANGNTLGPIDSIKKWWKDRKDDKAVKSIIAKIKSDPELIAFFKLSQNQQKGKFRKLVASKLSGEELQYLNRINKNHLQQKESVNEGKKAFKINPPIGKAKYSISAHDGVKTHKDGSDFYDIKIFKNKVDLEKGIKDYKSKGFVEESINEENPGLWANIRAKRERGEAPAPKNSQAYKDAVAAGKEINKEQKSLKREALKSIVREVMQEEAEYQAFFQKALDKAGKSIPSMSDEEKKAFFDKIDSAWNGKGEKNEALVGGQKELDVDKDGDIEGDDLADLRAGKKVNEGRYDADLDKIEAAVKKATSFMNVGSELKKAGIKYDFTTSMIPMYMIKVSGNTIAICNKKYAAGAEREVKDIAIGLLN